MTIAELQQSINLFVEAIEKLQTDKSEALAAAEEAAAAAARAEQVWYNLPQDGAVWLQGLLVEKEAGDVSGATEGVNATATALKSGIDALVAEVVGS